MEAVKRLEIVAHSVELPELLDIVEQAGASGYTVIREVQGKGGRGLRSNDTVTDVFKNSYILVACPADVALRIVEKVRPVLKHYGGICLLSDAQYILH